MDKKKIWTILYAAVCTLLVVSILIVIARFGRSDRESTQETVPYQSQEPIIRYVTQTETVYVDKLIPVEVEKTITTEILEEGLHSMGKLVTQEYLFKEVTTFESSKTFIWIFEANSKLVMGYEGVITAGIDFAAVRATKNDSNKTVTVIMPQAEIYQCSLDYNSFEVYEEDVSRANPITASDYNGSLLELQNKATDRALARGILVQANENAKQLISGFIGGLIDLKEYKLSFVIV